METRATVAAVEPRTPLRGAIADDVAGATDVSSALVGEGMRTVQTIGVVPDPDAGGSGFPGIDRHIVVAIRPWRRRCRGSRLNA
jgi:hypothetical protein